LKHISELLNNYVLEKDEWKIKLFNNWDKVIGNLKNKVVILKVENKLLVLGVTHPAWAQELFMLSDLLKNRINSLFEKEHIKYIRFQTLKFKQNESKNINEEIINIEKKENLNKLTLNKKEYKALTKIKDPELKESLKRLFLKCKEG
jgi:flagellar biogenesis protein FliO